MSFLFQRQLSESESACIKIFHLVQKLNFDNIATSFLKNITFLKLICKKQNTRKKPNSLVSFLAESGIFFLKVHKTFAEL